MDDSDPPIACTLPADRLGDRMADWQAILAPALGREPVEGGIRIRLPADVHVAALAALATAEQECCRFFTFVLTIDGDGIALDVNAPDDARPLVDALVGSSD
jgi:hypothetical protein